MGGKGKSESKLCWLWTQLESLRPAVAALLEVDNSLDEIRLFRKEARVIHYDTVFLAGEGVAGRKNSIVILIDQAQAAKTNFTRIAERTLQLDI